MWDLIGGSLKNMIEENAIVVSIEDDTALLEIVRRMPCSLCGQTRGCGISLFGRLFGHRNNVFKAVNQISAQIGDYVVVGIEQQALLASSLRVYGVPLLSVLAGAAIAAGFFAPAKINADGYVFAGALIGLVLGLLWLKGNASGRSLDARYRPVILRAGNAGIINLKCDRGE